MGLCLHLGLPSLRSAPSSGIGSGWDRVENSWTRAILWPIKECPFNLTRVKAVCICVDLYLLVSVCPEESYNPAELTVRHRLTESQRQLEEQNIRVGGTMRLVSNAVKFVSPGDELGGIIRLNKHRVARVGEDLKGLVYEVLTTIAYTTPPIGLILDTVHFNLKLSDPLNQWNVSTWVRISKINMCLLPLTNPISPPGRPYCSVFLNSCPCSSMVSSSSELCTDIEIFEIGNTSGLGFPVPDFSVAGKIGTRKHTSNKRYHSRQSFEWEKTSDFESVRCKMACD